MSGETPTSKYPLDYDSLKKGDTISQREMEEIFGLSREEKKFQLKVLSLQEAIQREMEARGQTVTMAQVHGDLRILTDAEAASKNHERVCRKVRGMMVDHRRQQAVDVKNLNQEEMQNHDRCLVVQSRLIQGMALTKNSLPTKEHRRLLPGLPTT